MRRDAVRLPAALLALLLALVVGACAAPAGEEETASPTERATAEEQANDAATPTAEEEDGDEGSSPEATEDGTAEEDGSARDVSVFDLEVGDCFSGAEGDQVTDVSVIDCDDAHQYEVFALIDHEAGAGEEYPGQDELETFADDECTGDAFESYVGLSYEESKYYATWLTPTERSWDELDDREVVCVLYEPEDPSDPVDAREISSSARDSEE